MKLSELVIKKPENGSIEGICVWCGQKTTSGHKIPVSSNFMGWGFFKHGDCMCPHCFCFFRNQSFRRKTWLATKKEVSFLKRVDVLPILLEPPDPPWFIYITKTGQRQGWLACAHAVNTSRTYFQIAFEPFDFPVLTTQKEVKEMAELITFLREKKISKTEIETGIFHMKTYQRAFEDKYENELFEAKKHKGKQIWEVICYASI